MQRNKNKRALTDAELSLFFWQAGLLMHSGIDLRDGLPDVLKDFAQPGLQTLVREVEGGAALNDAMRTGGLFPERACKLVAIGERAGRLEEILNTLSEDYARSARLSEAARDAVRYPLMLLSIIAAVVVVLLIWAMPVFARAYAGFGGQAAQRAAGWLGAGTLIARIVLALIVLLIAGVLICALMYRMGQGARLFKLMWRLPAVERICRDRFAAQLCATLGLLIGVGHPLADAFHLCAGLASESVLTNNTAIARTLNDVQASPVQALRDTGLFDELSLHILATGFRVGHADTACVKVSEIYFDDAETRTARVLEHIEPLLVGILCAVIGCIMLSVVLPLVGILANAL